MNSTMELQLNHRSIREFTDKEVSSETLEDLLDVVNRTATSTGMQAYSIIRVTDENIRKEFASITNQDYITRLPELFIFLVDQFRNGEIAKEQGFYGEGMRDMDRFFQGFTDAVLGAQNLTIAVESMGMGAVYFGSILNDPDKVIEILGLPERTFPVLGVGFGYPNQEPQKKPRMSMDLKCFENKYLVYEDYLKEIEDYDDIIQTYYDLRDANRRVDSFRDQVVKRYSNVNEKRSKILKSIEKQGFNLGI